MQAMDAGIDMLSRWSAIVVLSLLLSGCRPSYQRETAPVRGQVTVDSQPATSGYVVVVPASGRMAKGIIQNDGSFIMGTYEADDGVQLGTHPVVVHPVPAEENFSRKLPGPTIPERYGISSTSHLQIEVTEKGNENWRLDLKAQ
jgi:hypothetical protein